MTDPFISPEQINQPRNPGVFLGRVGDPGLERIDGLEVVYPPSGAIGLTEATVRELANLMAGDDLSIVWIDPGERETHMLTGIPDHVALNTAERLLEVDGKHTKIPSREFEVLSCFFRNPYRILSRTEILNKVWAANDDYEFSKDMVSVHIFRVRKRLGEYSQSIQTHTGLGYRFDPSYPFEQE